MNQPASITITTGRAPPGPATRRLPEPIKTVSFQECVREIERAIAQMIELDTEMTDIEDMIKEYQMRIDDEDTDEWDRIDLEQDLPNLHYRWGQGCTQLAIEMTSIAYHGQMLIDDWRELEIDRIGRKHAQFDRFYLRAEREWPALASGPVWMRLRGEAVPF